jgi:hypothetical protein
MRRQFFPPRVAGHDSLAPAVQANDLGRAVEGAEHEDYPAVLPDQAASRSSMLS